MANIRKQQKRIASTYVARTKGGKYSARTISPRGESRATSDDAVLAMEAAKSKISGR